MCVCARLRARVCTCVRLCVPCVCVCARVRACVVCGVLERFSRWYRQLPLVYKLVVTLKHFGRFTTSKMLIKDSLMLAVLLTKHRDVNKGDLSHRRRCCYGLEPGRMLRSAYCRIGSDVSEKHGASNSGSSKRKSRHSTRRHYVFLQRQ
jgi:hypothetical protein